MKLTKPQIQVMLSTFYDCFYYHWQQEYFLEKHKEARKKYAEDVKRGLVPDFSDFL